MRPTKEVPRLYRAGAQSTTFCNHQFAIIVAGGKHVMHSGEVLNLEQLTRRETDVVRLVAIGLTNPEIAYSLDISIKTVQTHLINVFKKWGIAYRTEAALLAVGRYVSLEDAQAAILARAYSAETWQ